MKLFLITLLFSSFVYAIDGVKNIKLNTIDSADVFDKIANRFTSEELQNLKVYGSYKTHIKNIENLKVDIQEILVQQYLLQKTNKKLKLALQIYNNDEQTYTQRMKAIYKQNSIKKREIYFLLSYPTNIDYTPNLQNYLVEHYALEKFHQKTDITENQTGLVSYSNVINTTKDLGQIREETIQDITYRDKNTNIRLLKVVQSPFSNKAQDSESRAFETSVDKFDLPENVLLFQIKDTKKIKKILNNSLKLTPNDVTSFQNTIKESINLKKANKKLKYINKKINKTIQKITTTHKNYTQKLTKDLKSVNILLAKLQTQKKELQSLTKKAQQIAQYYSIDLNLYELDKLIILQPKLYSEKIELGEEKEFVTRKSKSYLSKINITSLVQSEQLNNGYDLKTKNINKQKLLEYKSSHIFVFAKGTELSMLIFDVIALKDKVSKSDYVIQPFKYSSLTFVPVKYKFDTFFITNTEINLGIVKEFLKTHRQNKYFDKYCIQDSTLPEEAKNFTAVSPLFYNYPAVCFKVEKIDDFLQWISKKTHKKIKLPSPKQWSYTASNFNTSKYCWGNSTLEELIEDGRKPANIYYEDYKDTAIKPIKQYKSSIVGMYDMCGNVQELVKKNNMYGIKGMSYISFIEEANAPMSDYNDELNSAIGLRLLYKKEN